MELTMNGFEEMSHQEMMDVDGGNRRRNTLIASVATFLGSRVSEVTQAAVAAKKGAKLGAAKGAFVGPKGALIGAIAGAAIAGGATWLAS